MAKPKTSQTIETKEADQPAETEGTYEEKLRQLSVLRQKAAEADRQAAELEKEIKSERKVSLEYRKNLTRHPACEKIIQRYVLISAGIGLLPIPGIDMAALTGAQIKMIDELAEQFGQNFTEKQSSNMLTALTGGMLGPLAAPAVASATVVIPLVGPLLTIFAKPGAAAASTRLVGYLALERLEKEEKLGTLDAAKMQPMGTASTPKETEIPASEPAIA
jgi:uncharacterized protein (DUF697 family)